MKNLFCKLFLTSVAAVSTLSLSAQDAAARHAFATFNIRYTNTTDNVANNPEGKSWDLRGPYVIQIVRDYNFDIVGMQEVTGRDNGKGNSMAHGTGLSQLETIKQELSDYTIFEWERDGNKDYSYNVLAFKTDKYESLESGCFWLSPTPDTPSTGWEYAANGTSVNSDAQIRRTCGWSKMRVKATGEEFVFAVTHVNYGALLDGPNSGRLIVERLSAIAGDLPVVLVGDFNMRVKDHPDAFREYMSYFSHARMSADGALCIPEDNGQIAWTTTGWTTADKATSGSEFDHIFYRNMHAHNYYVITENYGRGVNPSDHYPVMVEVTLGNDVQDVYVDADAAAGGDGSKSAPFNTIADAINTAYAGSTIHITADTYDETLNVVSPVNFVGGYDSSFENIVGKTVIDGLGEKSRMVYSQYSGLYLENFKICNAVSTNSLTDGAIATDGGALHLTNVEVVDNVGSALGGGVYSTSSDVAFTSCLFSGNSAVSGSAAYLLGARDIQISGSTFEKNVSTKNGVLSLIGESEADKYSIWNSTFANNQLQSPSGLASAVKKFGGAAVYASFLDVTPRLNLGHNTIVGNVATFKGSNKANFYGAAVNIVGGELVLINNIIAGNYSECGDGFSDVAVDSSNSLLKDQYNVFTAESTIGFYADEKDFVADSYSSGIAALAQTLDGVVDGDKFVANLGDNGGLTPTVKPIAKTYNNVEIAVLTAFQRYLETSFGVDLNQDGKISGTLTTDQRGVAREASTIPGACEYIDPAAIDDIYVSQSGVSIAALGANQFAISADQTIGHLAVYNLSGASIRSTSVDDNVYTLNLSDCASGVYVVVVGDIAAKVVVK